jgi:hypothetical protein
LKYIPSSKSFEDGFPLLEVGLEVKEKATA